YDFDAIVPSMEPVVDVDWVVVRKVAAVEPFAWIGPSVPQEPQEPQPQISDFSHIDQVSITPATPVTDYAIRLNLDSSFNYAACQADGDDIRFFDNSNAPLSFWIEKWTIGGDSILWIKIPAAGTESVQMAYGNATIGPGSNGEATFPLFDDFSATTINLMKWSVESDQYSSVSVTTGRVHVQSFTPNPFGSYTKFGFSDATSGHGIPNSLHSTNDVSNQLGDLVTYNGTTPTWTLLGDNLTWLLADYRWIDGSNAVFSENETIKGVHTTNVPDASIPVLFIARCFIAGPGTNYAGVLRSIATFGPGYALRTYAYLQHGDWLSLEPYIDVDWVFVRKCSSIESVACLVNGTDVVSPHIVTSGYSGSTIEQGDVEDLTWTIYDAHPSTYSLLLNGVPIQSGSYSSGSSVTLQIDSTTLGQLNYTMIASDTAGNVGRNEKLITVMERTDGGIFLMVGINRINRNGTYAMTLTFDMSHWTVLYLNVNVSILPTSLVLPGALPTGLVIALPVAFSLNLVNASALRSGTIRVYYDQEYIASKVNEKDIVALRWNAVAESWIPAACIIHDQNYIEIPLSENGLYVVASTPKQNYIPIIIIVLISITGGIVTVAAGYNHVHKKHISVKNKSNTTSTKAKKASTYTSTVGSTATEHPLEASLEKRARLMRVSIPRAEPATPLRSISSSEMMEILKPAENKAGVTSEPDIDITTRAANAQEMASEVNLERVVSHCVVHKGAVLGVGYSCKRCGTVYCVKCARHLVENGESCWTCKEPIALDDDDDGESNLPKITVGRFSPEVWQKINELDISDEIFDEVIEDLKGIPPSNRIKYLEKIFKDDEPFDSEF
nr:DUF2341 domain-containing protein [Candidatus Sigynarchaeum springense]